MDLDQGNKLVVFVKAPVPGRVKTRLAMSIGAEAACVAYQELVLVLLERIASLRGVELRFAPDDAGAGLKGWLRSSWDLQPQGGGDLGERMISAFREKFGQGCSRVVLIGSDCPAVTSADIEAAWAALDGKDLVLGPAVDGGYWLVGLRADQPALFRGVTWSEPTVLEETLGRAEAEGLSVELLRELTDVDTEAEWEAFKRGR